ncbi:Sigma-fimbriae chaperone protein [Klebsiella michiganensis]|uniref:Sigma-fimbriae chaperone protein n=1 Tax=Klebsiella michiganensis TaxID=1134687 RepID=A0A7H4PK81_9ENTR|nr:Sigma-fimbriae chaperone protein [Klebsiella michiganensis]
MIRCRFAPFIFALLLPSSVLAASSVSGMADISKRLESHETGVLNCGWRIAAARRLICSCACLPGIKKASADVYADQRDVVASPPFTTVAPGQRQLVRLMRVAPIANGQKSSPIALLSDEIPAAQPAAQTEQNAAGLKMRMRYVLPLFTYGQGVTPLKNAGSVEPVRATLRLVALAAK